MTLIETIPAALLSARDRISQLGTLGEAIASERLVARGFDCKPTPPNYPYADLIAVRGAERYFVGVKARNEKRAAGKGDNGSYNIVKISDAKRRLLEERGKTENDITQMLWHEVRLRAKAFDAVPAWVTIPILPLDGIYSAYFGVVPEGYRTRSIPMTAQARRTHDRLIERQFDQRITPDLLNTKRSGPRR
jgi:hypothetical protein